MNILIANPNFNTLELELEDTYKNIVPIKIHAKDIRALFNGTVNFIYDVEKQNTFESLRLREIKNLKRNFKFIDIESKLFDNLTKNFLEYNEIETLDELLNIEDTSFFIELNRYIDERVSWITNEIRRQISFLFHLETEKPNIVLKKTLPDMPKNIEEYVQRDYTYVLTQTVIEYNPTPIFYENIGKSISEWSLRELEYHLCYITAKSRKEEIENKFVQKEMEKQRADSK